MSNSIAILVLAAGGSTRLNKPKQLVEFRGQTLLRRAVAAAVEVACGPVFVVLGAHAVECRTALDELAARITTLDNANWPNGVSTSIQLGIAAAADASVKAAIVMTCDQPFADAAHLKRLVARYRVTGCAAIASGYRNTLGVPALFDQALFPQLAMLRGDHGAKGLIQSLVPDVAGVDFPLGEHDIDTAADVDELSGA